MADYVREETTSMGKRRNWIDETSQPGGLPLHLRNVLSLIKHVLAIIAVTLATSNLTYASHQHSGPECYDRNGKQMYVPDGFDYPRQAWAGWGISCRTPKLERAAGSGATAPAPGDRPVEWCGWWMRQHLGGQYGPEFNVARNWLSVGRPLDGPRPGAIGVKAHHVFQVVRVVDREHVLAISGNDHNAVQTRIRPTSDVIGWRDVTEESTTAHKAADEHPTLQQPAAGMTAPKSDQTATKHFAIKDTVGNCSVIDVQPSWTSGMQLLGNKNGYSSVKDAQAAVGSDCKGKIDRG
jgi:hypothetical protein